MPQNAHTSKRTHARMRNDQESTVNQERAIERFLVRAVENVYPTREKLGELLASGKRITVYLGIDPTSPTLHLGHAIALRKLAELQKIGHRVILLIGDFTAMLGDPTDKLATRKQLTRDEVLANCKEYKTQASMFLDFDGPNPAELKFNSEWLATLTFADVIELAAHFTVQQMSERDMFRRRMSWRSTCPNCGNENYLLPEEQETAVDASGRRILVSSFDRETWVCKKCKRPYSPEAAGELHSPRPVFLHEFFYPLMQGYDSVAMDVDLEVGGNDQTFNMLAGRTLLREIQQKEKFVLTTKLLVDPTGKKMGKTEGNMITLADDPREMYGKVMSWTDDLIVPGFELCTDVSSKDIEEMRAAMANGENPMRFKQRLARDIVAIFVSRKAANEAEAQFAQVHQKHEVPEHIPVYTVGRRASGVVDILIASGLVASRNDARRQIEQGAVKVDREVVQDVNTIVRAGSVIQKGKRHFVRLV